MSKWWRVIRLWSELCLKTLGEWCINGLCCSLWLPWTKSWTHRKLRKQCVRSNEKTPKWRWLKKWVCYTYLEYAICMQFSVIRWICRKIFWLPTFTIENWYELFNGPQLLVFSSERENSRLFMRVVMCGFIACLLHHWLTVFQLILPACCWF